MIRPVHHQKDASSSKLSEEDCNKLFEQGKMGIYHPGAVLRDFDIADAQKILAGEKGPFKDNPNGHDVTFVLMTKQGNFFFSATYL
jgi:hypothetical protein